jgi:succinate dehydrogenase / fumarate reductase flavoprotein subunit/L-aspartate oxidase
MIDQLSGEGTVRREFPGKFILFERHGIDISKEPMLVYPTLHYQNGGLKIDAAGATSVPALYAAGEVTGGIHGENRLMGNSLLDVLVFGRIAGKNAAAFASEHGAVGNLGLDHVRAYHRELESAGIAEGAVAPMVLPDYTDPHVRRRQLTSHYLGTLR